MADCFLPLKFRGIPPNLDFLGSGESDLGNGLDRESPEDL